MNRYLDERLKNKKQPKKISISFDDMLSMLAKKSENAQITFWHRFIYQHDNMRVLISIHKKLTQKLSFLGLINTNPELIKYDDDSVEIVEETIKNR